ncbi:type II toxin-antitoxin system RelE/ParE family toxin [Rhizobium sp. FKL33]|uniref:type II toxin-antitoxin system RelE/ParE family toxin n=1 Tax=Rhizobium sp. FKL33 TaxID=2562307 RepID=UPI0010C10ED2|nr:type II toxin-antitoxin system RelE/ParE family toxin [Rhizobium sp. FKL33]
MKDGWTFSYSETALRGLASIYRYIAEQNPDAASRFIVDIDHKISALAHNKVRGAPRDWLHQGLRVFPYKERCIYFIAQHHQIRVIRVLHGRQNVTPDMFAPNAED